VAHHEVCSARAGGAAHARSRGILSIQLGLQQRAEVGGAGTRGRIWLAIFSAYVTHPLLDALAFAVKMQAPYH